MVVCSCRAVSDRVVRAVIDDGARSIEEVTEGCAAGRRCGGCWPELERLIAEHAGSTETAVLAVA